MHSFCGGIPQNLCISRAPYCTLIELQENSMMFVKLVRMQLNHGGLDKVTQDLYRRQSLPFQDDIYIELLGYNFND